MMRHKPYTGRDDSTYIETIAADNGVPTAGDSTVAHFSFTPTTGPESATKQLAPRVVDISAVFGGVGAAAADITVSLWQFDPYTEQWYGTNTAPLVAPAIIGATAGSIARVDCDPNRPLAYLQVVGLDGDETVSLCVTKVE
jgi:hypothetical protein